jgi:DNA-binding GntR family transcriptional regulator/ribosomal protein L37AE/L43A
LTHSQTLPQRHKSLYEQTYLALRSSILSGAISRDERLVETQLAAQLNVSRTPIREAIRRLQQENLLVTHNDGRLYVAKLSLHDAIKLYDCRIALEQLAVQGVCEHATEKQINAIEQTLVQAENLAKRDSLRSPYKLLELNLRFHRLIAQSCDNPWLVPILDQLSDQTTLLRIQLLQDPPDIADIHAEHRQIYEAIARRDIATATEASAQHLLQSQQRIVQIFQQREPSSQTINSASIPRKKETKIRVSQKLICPNCQSSSVNRNGNRDGKQNYLCKQCGRQFLESYLPLGYSPEIREKCIKMHAEGLGFREIERQTGVNHNTVIRWVKASNGLGSSG